MLVECIQASIGYPDEDGIFREPWCKVGDQEWSLPRRYRYSDGFAPGGESVRVRPSDERAIPFLLTHRTWRKIRERSGLAPATVEASSPASTNSPESLFPDLFGG